MPDERRHSARTESPVEACGRIAACPAVRIPGRALPLSALRFPLSEHVLQPRQRAQPLVDGEHFPGVLDLRFDADGDVATARRLADAVRGIDFPFQLVANGRHGAGHEPLLAAADHLEGVRAGKLVRVFEQFDGRDVIHGEGRSGDGVAGVSAGSTKNPDASGIIGNLRSETRGVFRPDLRKKRAGGPPRPGSAIGAASEFGHPSLGASLTLSADRARIVVQALVFHDKSAL